jgi:hypothetical protein
MLRKFILVSLAILLLSAALPVASVFAAPGGEDPNPDKGKDAYPRLEKAFQRAKDWYDKQGEFLAKSGDFINKAETFIGRADQKGLDTSSLKLLLESFASSIPVVQSAHDRAGAILSAHNGFDENGKVTDVQAASQTVKDAATALQEGRQAHLGKGKALAEAIKAFWQANKPPRPIPSEKPFPAPGE